MVSFNKSNKISISSTQLNYIFTSPDDVKEGESLPLIVFLHGAGERGDDISKVNVYCIPKLFTENPQHKGLRVYTLSPQCPLNTTWIDYKRELMALIDDVISTNNIDKSRVALCGISMGGFGTWEMAMTYSDRFYKIAPLCGGGMNWRCWSLKMPIRVYHGKLDDVVPISQSEAMVNSVKIQGGQIEFTVYDDLSHNCWDRAFCQTDLVEWLADYNYQEA
ncbi:MAG: dienelactone hydrolase family protein [Clostridia bacterium]|nr:dienelactone hydrolase family protein [Clostridia bacterium]